MVEALSVREASRRVDRETRTIYRWIEDGMPTHLVKGERVILLTDLQARFVQHLRANPIRPRSAAALEHGTRNLYRKGCRCEPCREGNAVYQRGRYAKRLQETAERRAAVSGRVSEPAVVAVPRPYRRRQQQAA